MDNQIIFKCFQTPKGCYLYDRYSNSVIRVSTEQYDELVKIEAGLAEASSSYVIKELQEKGICLPGEVKEIFHPMTPFLTHLLQHRIRDVILQVTQNCNLRCGYCTYGGNYKNRTHSLKTMNFELAKKAIDFGVERSQESSDFVVSFYGGEPLLAFNLIKKCVAYAKENIQGKELHFNMTTNGTLLTTEIMDFLVENRFQLLISLDGDKESHDANRVFKSGKGSFDLIMQNVRNFKARHPSYVAEHVQFNTVINPKTNPSCFDEFFSVSSVFQDTHIMFNEVASSNVKENSLVSFGENYRIKRKFEFLKLFMSMSGKLDERYVSRLVKESKRSYYDLYKELRLHTAMLSATIVFATSATHASADNTLEQEETFPTMMASYYDKASGNTLYTFDDGKTYVALSEEEEAELFYTPDIEWWTYDEYKQWMEEEKQNMEDMIGEKCSDSHGEYVWSQEDVDAQMKIYEQFLDDLKNGKMLSKTVDGNPDLMIGYDPSLATSSIPQ